MHILVATDKFKDALTASQVCESLQKGMLKTFPEATFQLQPLADGGEGTLQILSQTLKGEFITCEVYDPLHRKITAAYLWIENTRTAVIEMARASGVELLRKSERNCLITNTYGTGELIKHTLDRNTEEIILTVGGSATNDAGIGMASALGYQFLDKKGQLVQPCGQNLGLIEHIDTSKVHPVLVRTKFTVATDVINPFFGENGAAYVFAAQKGADSDGIIQLNAGLQHFSEVLLRTFGKNVQEITGSGAGGGMGGGAVCFLNAQVKSAADWILEITEFEKKISLADVFITGEGKIDAQSWQGKLISRVLALAEKHKVPAILVCGTLQDIESIKDRKEILYAVSILNEPISLHTALQNTSQLLENQGILLGKLLRRDF